MPSPDPAPLTFYKAYCFRPLSPTYNEWARLTAADVHALRERPEFEGQQIYFQLNHPIKWIRLVGVVVDFEAYSNRFIIVLDDSSGTNIEVTCGRASPAVQNRDVNAATGHTPVREQARMIGNTAQGNSVDLTGVDIGSIIKVKGGIGCFRGEKQLALERLTFVRTTNEEAEAWAQTAAFQRDILSKPWIVSEQDERRARRKAEGHEERQRARDEQRRKIRHVEETQKRRRRQKGQSEREMGGHDGNKRRAKAVSRGHGDKERKAKAKRNQQQPVERETET